jgi:non-ribosomal peptide synthase protein (TIGR01720 family)
LVPDLAAAWEAIVKGITPVLSARGTSFRRWSQRLETEAADAQRVAEFGFWRGMLQQPAAGLVDDGLSLGADGRLAQRQQFTLTLPAAVTGPLLTRVPAAFHGGINDVLLTGLVVAIAAWRRRRGRGASAAVLIDIEGHGREEIFRDVDLSRTVGWFTSLYPMRLDPGPLDVEEAMAGGPALGRAVKLIKEQLHAVPNHGVGYGLLRYLNPQTARELDGLARPQLGFNYLGRFPGAPGANWAGAAEADVLGGGDSDLPLAHAVEINALTLEGADGATLRVNWTWSPALIDETDLRALAQDWFQALAALVRHTAQPSAGGRTPSDLPLVPLSQSEIERLERAYAR